MTKDEHIYIAGPLCFYPDGGKMWNAFRQEAEFYGFDVTLPNDNKLVGPDEKPTKEEMSRRIFQNCADSMAKTNGIIVNLETYRGSEPDGGSIYELGMAYGVGAKCYGFTRDKRRLGVKYQAAKYNSDMSGATDIYGDNLGHPELPFSVDLIGSMKIIEGSFSDCLKVYMADIEEESKQKAMRGLRFEEDEPCETLIKGEKPVVFISDFHRDDLDAKEKYAEKKAILEKYGFVGIAPTDDAPGVENIETDDPYEKAYNIFDRYQQHVRNCDIILSDLNDYRGGYEPASDVAFEAGMAFELGKKMYGYMDNIGPMVDRIPNGGEENGFRDFNGMNVENFNAPINLMFGASVKLLDGSFEDIVRKMAEDLKTQE
ncbi:MAG: nucleoside 2-deoxyribosyltransferase [Oscillospiraceae bacterium]|nr:nucleoside 2-deoxyribosyltransferase [Oscillospiraceae bacterium]